MNNYIAGELKDDYWDALKWKTMIFEEKKQRSLERYKESVKEKNKSLLSTHGVVYGYSEQPVFMKAHQQTYHWKLNEEDVAETM